jgi:hypothetical protein
MLKFFACLFAALITTSLLAGCTTPLPEPVAINPAPTETPILPTSTPRPTSTTTLTPTPTATPTITPSLTNSPTVTSTPYGEPVGDFQYNFTLTNSREGEPDDFIRPPNIVRNINFIDSDKFADYKWMALAVTKIHYDQDGVPISYELGFIYNNRLYSYPVEFGGVKHNHYDENAEWFHATLLVPFGYRYGNNTFNCTYQGRAANLNKFLEYVNVGDVVVEAVPIGVRKEVPKDFPFWKPWFDIQSKRIEELLPGMRELVKFVEEGGEPPNPSRIRLYSIMTEVKSPTCIRW